MGSAFAPVGGGGGPATSSSVIDCSAPPFNASSASADNASAINACLAAACGAGAIPGKSASLPPGTFTILSTLSMYDTTNSRVTDRCVLRGAGTGLTTVQWSGTTATQPAIQMVGAFQTITELSLAATTPWLTGIGYDGNSSVGRSTHGVLRNIQISCNNNGAFSQPGDGIQLGKGGTQADMLEIDHPYIKGCFNGISLWNGNVLSINVIAPTMVRNHAGVYRAVTSNINVFGGEFDENDLNFSAGGGYAINIYGIGTEGSKRQYYENRGSYPSGTFIDGYSLRSSAQTRPAANGTIVMASSSTTLTLSTPSFIEGDQIVIPGAGVGGTTLSTTITALGTDYKTATISPAASTSVVAASITLDSGKVQYQFSFGGLGPYKIKNSTFADATGDYMNSPTTGGTLVIESNNWFENNLNMPTNAALPNTIFIESGNVVNGNATTPTWLPLSLYTATISNLTVTGTCTGCGAGGTGSPGGLNTQLQYNNNGAFGGIANNANTNYVLQSNGLSSVPSFKVNNAQQVNGGALPTSAGVVGTNSSAQLISAGTSGTSTNLLIGNGSGGIAASSIAPGNIATTTNAIVLPTGTTAAVTPSQGDNSLNLATTAYVDGKTTPVSPLYSCTQTVSALANGSTGNLALTCSGCSGGVCTMATPPASDATYRVEFQFILTTQGVACTAGVITPQLLFTDPDNGATYTNFFMNFRLGNGQSLQSTITPGTSAPAIGTNYIGIPMTIHVSHLATLRFQMNQTTAEAACTTLPALAVRIAVHGPLGY